MTDQATPYPATNLRAERALLGALLIDPEAIGRVADLVAIDDLASSRHRDWYEAMLALRDAGSAVDVVTVLSMLAPGGGEPTNRDGAYACRLVNEAMTSCHAVHYARIVAQTAAARRGSQSSELPAGALVW